MLHIPPHLLRITGRILLAIPSVYFLGGGIYYFYPGSNEAMPRLASPERLAREATLPSGINLRAVEKAEACELEEAEA